MKLKRLLSSFSGKLTIFVLIYFFIAAILAWIVIDDWSHTAISTDTVSMGYTLPADSEISQSFTAPMDELQWIDVTPHNNNQENTGSITFALYNQDTLLWSKEIEASFFHSDVSNEISVQPALCNVAGQSLTLRITPHNTNGFSFWAGSTISTGKFDFAVDTDGLLINNEPTQGNLVLTVSGINLLNSGHWFWPGALLVFICLLVLLISIHYQNIRNISTPLTALVHLVKQYRYLLQQLVWRDFRVKYKASVLGMLWSFLNPLLTMIVYYFVFSTLFHNNIEYFPVYLMSGIILFNYFSESSSLGLNAIVGNSALITKVYMPKIIYPLSKVLSSAINLCISFIPLLLVMLFSGVPFSKSILLLPIVVIYLLVFCLGISLILSTMNVFFRDTQFLWSVLITMWNFLTPIFYPESIIPQQFITLYHMNPMYQIVFFMRSITIGGVSPTPITYLYCTLASFGTLALGLWIFRKHQDRFVLYL